MAGLHNAAADIAYALATPGARAERGAAVDREVSSALPQCRSASRIKARIKLSDKNGSGRRPGEEIAGRGTQSRIALCHIARAATGGKSNPSLDVTGISSAKLWRTP
jgi:hypothetical protein